MSQAYGGVFPGSPPLDPDSYSKCYAMELDGFVSVSSTQNIQTMSTDNNTYQFANQFRYLGLHSMPLAYALASKGFGTSTRVTGTACPSTPSQCNPGTILL